MYFIIIFVLFLVSTAVLSIKKKDLPEFMSFASFVTGITQMLMLFALFILIFNGVKKSEYTIDTNEMMLMYLLDFSAILIFLASVFLRMRTAVEKVNKSIILKELVQLYLPVVILNVSIRILSTFNLNEHGYIYAKLANKYMYALFFKFIFTLSSMFLIKTLNSHKKRDL